MVRQALPSTSSSFKSIAATKKEIADHYDMGNDFFGAFMGPLMIYTSAIFHGLHQTLEQVRKRHQEKKVKGGKGKGKRHSSTRRSSR